MYVCYCVYFLYFQWVHFERRCKLSRIHVRTQLAERARPETHFHYHVVYRIVQLSVIEENITSMSQWQHRNIYYVYVCAALGSQIALLLVRLAQLGMLLLIASFESCIIGVPKLA